MCTLDWPLQRCNNSVLYITFLHQCYTVGISGTNLSESLCMYSRDGAKTKWQLQWCISVIIILARSKCYALWSMLLSIFSTALVNQMANIATNRQHLLIYCTINVVHYTCTLYICSTRVHVHVSYSVGPPSNTMLLGHTVCVKQVLVIRAHVHYTYIYTVHVCRTCIHINICTYIRTCIQYVTFTCPLIISTPPTR